MLAKKYKSIITSINAPLDGICTLEFRSLGRPYKYLPGQFLHLAIDADYDGVGQWPESRCFSMQSNPDEESIRITYSVKGAFTTQMRDQLKTGDEVWLKLPYGDLFQQPHNKENALFIAGGTGITPFLSLFTHSSFVEYKNPLLYAGFRSSNMNLYKHELEQAKIINPEFESEFVYENAYGSLNINEIYKRSSHCTAWFISGPPLMIKAFKSYLIDAGMPDESVFTDEWE